MKQTQTWQVYCYDQFGAEHKAGQYEAKSKGHAMALARQAGVKKVCDAVVVD